MSEIKNERLVIFTYGMYKPKCIEDTPIHVKFNSEGHLIQTAYRLDSRSLHSIIN
jgi:hypothetical protein